LYQDGRELKPGKMVAIRDHLGLLSRRELESDIRREAGFLALYLRTPIPCCRSSPPCLNGGLFCARRLATFAVAVEVNCGFAMQVTLTKELERFVKTKVQGGRYADESEVVREALRALERRDDYESPALEAALIEGVRSPHRPYTKSTLGRIRKNARAPR
jgi:putative addiction module CopG family antidote